MAPPGFAVVGHQLAEQAARLHELLWRERLVADGQHVITREIGIQAGAQRVRYRTRQIETENFRSRRVTRERLQLVVHADLLLDR